MQTGPCAPWTTSTVAVPAATPWQATCPGLCGCSAPMPRAWSWIGHGLSLPSGVRRSSSVHDLLVLVHAEGSTAACCSSSLLADQSTVSAQAIRRVGVRQHDERVVDAGVTSAIYVDILREVLRDVDDRLWHLFSSDDDADTDTDT